ncbi:hypothetical protein B566_EDAN000964, partial [Ephemera danica]
MASHQHQSGDDDGWIPGLGDNKPQPRRIGKAFFGYVPEDQITRTPEMPSERSSRKDSQEASLVSSPNSTQHPGSEDSLREEMLKVTVSEQPDGAVTEEIVMERVQNNLEADPIP